MRIPQYYRAPLWQRFFSGIIVGIVIGWLFFISIYGMAQERQINKIKKLQTEKQSLIRDKEILYEEEKKKNEALQKKLTIQDIKIIIKDKKDQKLEQITKYELKSAIEERIHSIINSDIESVATNKLLIYRAIEGHTFTIDNKRYQLSIESIVIYTTLELTLKVDDIQIS